MARKNEAAELLIRGYSIPKIAKEMGISPTSVKQYLCTVVGETSFLGGQLMAFTLSPGSETPDFSPPLVVMMCGLYKNGRAKKPGLRLNA